MKSNGCFKNVTAQLESGSGTLFCVQKTHLVLVLSRSSITQPDGGGFEAGTDCVCGEYNVNSQCEDTDSNVIAFNVLGEIMFQIPTSYKFRHFVYLALAIVRLILISMSNYIPILDIIRAHLNLPSGSSVDSIHQSCKFSLSAACILLT